MAATEGTDLSTVITTEEGTHGGPKPVDPRLADSNPTKAALKCFEFVARGDLSSYHIPKKPQSNMDDSDAAGGTPLLTGTDTSARAAPSLSLPVPSWPAAGVGYQRSSAAPSYQNYGSSAAPSYQNYWEPSWEPEAAYWHNYYNSGASFDYYGDYDPAAETVTEHEEDPEPRGPAPEPQSEPEIQTPLSGTDITADMITGETNPTEDGATMLAQPEWDLTALNQQIADFGSDDGPAIHATLTTHLNAVWKKGSANKIKEIHEKHALPAGCHMYRAALNESIASYMQANEKTKYPYVRDVKLKGVQGLIARAAVPLAKTCEDIMRKDKPLTGPQRMELAMDGMALLSSANQQVNQLRKDLIKPSMNAKLRATVCRAVREEDPSEWLFPDLLESTKQAKQASGLMAYQGRGRARGRGRFHPYFGPPGGFGGGYGRGFSPRGNFFPPRGEYVSFEHCLPFSSFFAMPWALPQFDTEFDVVNAPILMNNNDVSPVCYRRSAQLPQGQRTETRPRVVPPAPPAPPALPSLPQVGTVPAPPIHDKWGHFKACRAKMCLRSWRQHTSDPWLLKNLHGYKLELVDTPYQAVPNREIHFSKKEEDFMAQEITTLLTKGVIEESPEEEVQFISNVFLRQKKEKGKFRMIFNLTKLNEFVEYRHFKMETLETALKMVTKNAFMASLDFTDAYYTLPIHDAHR
jgi:hypothetical protein